MTKTEVKKIEIIQKDNPLLRKISTPVPLAKIKSPEIKAIISDMKKTIKNQTDAVAISAVQIAQPVRIFVVSKKFLKLLITVSQKLKILWQIQKMILYSSTLKL